MPSSDTSLSSSVSVPASSWNAFMVAHLWLQVTENPVHGLQHEEDLWTHRTVQSSVARGLVSAASQGCCEGLVSLHLSTLVALGWLLRLTLSSFQDVCCRSENLVKTWGPSEGGAHSFWSILCWTKKAFLELLKAECAFPHILGAISKPFTSRWIQWSQEGLRERRTRNEN